MLHKHHIKTLGAALLAFTLWGCLFESQQTLPKALEGVSAKNTGVGEVTLTWDKPEEEPASIMIRARTDGEYPENPEDGELMATVDGQAISVVLDSLEEKTVYHFSVFPLNTYDIAGQKQDVSPITTLDATAPETLKNLEAETSHKQSVKLTWDPLEVEDADSIMLRYDSGSSIPTGPDEGELGLLLAANAEEGTVTDLKENTRYNFSAFVRDTSGNWSAGVTTSITTPWTALYVFSTDFTSGSLQRMSVAGSELETGSFSVYKDSRLTTDGEYLYVLERFGADNIMKIDPSKTDEEAVVYQTHLGDLWNPHQMAFHGEGKAYIALEGVPYVLTFDTEAGEILDSIITRDYIYQPGPNDSGFAADSPHATDLLMDGNNLYVMLQRRNGDWQQPKGFGMVLKINASEDKIIDTLSTIGKNPQNLVMAEGELYVTTIGEFSDLEDGAIERLDFQTGESVEILTESDLGGNPVKMIHREGSEFYVLVYAAWGDVAVKRVDLESGEILATLPDVTDAGSDLYFDREEQRLFVTERDVGGPGIKVFDENDELLYGPLETDVPPSSLAAVPVSP